MRFEIIVVVLSACCLSAVLSRAPLNIPELVCKSKDIGPRCSYSKDQSSCKGGYTCKAGYCCRGPVCPKGWIGEKSCNLAPGKQRCADGYQCIDGFCCKPRIVKPPVRNCPKGTTPVPGECRRYPFPYRSFSILSPRCPKGSHCYSGTCCRTLTNAELCPRVRPPKVCPVYKKDPDQCKVNSDCPKGNICCKGPCGVKFCYRVWNRY